MASSSYSANLTAKVDRTVVSEEESLQLTVRLDEQVGYGGPNFDLLEQDFDIINQQRSNQFRSINGRTEGWTEWNIAIAPKKTGKLLIPSFKYEDAYSDAIEITVNEFTGSTTDGAQDLFATIEVDKPEVFVQEQILVKVKIHTAVDLRDIAAANEFAVENAIVEKVSDTTYRKNLGQRSYRVNEAVYAVYPQKSGELIIPNLSWMAVVTNPRSNWDRNPFFSNGTTRRFRASGKTLNVKAKPANYTGSVWLPAQNVAIEQHWSSDPDRFVVGEPITRSITISAKGLTSSQLSPLDEQTVDGIRFYSDQPQFDDIKESDGVTGYRIENFAIVPSKSGKITLPEIAITWWDTLSKQQKTTTLPAQIFTVSPAAFNPNTARGSSANSAIDGTSHFESSDSFGSGSTNSLTSSLFSNKVFWALIASNITLAICTLFFLFAWLSSRSQKTSETLDSTEDEYSTKNLNRIFNKFRLACNDNKAAQARDYLAQWAQLYWHLPQPASLTEIAKRCDSPDITKALEQLDKILYGNESNATWSGKALWNGIVSFKQADRKNHQTLLKTFRSKDVPTKGAREGLTTLYP